MTNELLSQPVETSRELLLFGLTILGMLITILSVWSNMLTKLKNSETNLLVKLKDHEVQIIRLDRDFMALDAKHEKDMRLVREDFEQKMCEIVNNNREDHAKMFDKMERINSTISGMSAALREHLKTNDYDKNH